MFRGYAYGFFICLISDYVFSCATHAELDNVLLVSKQYDMILKLNKLTLICYR